MALMSGADVGAEVTTGAMEASNWAFDLVWACAGRSHGSCFGRLGERKREQLAL
jgi:hypothetical protein